MDETVRDEEIFIISLVERCHYKFSLDSVKHKLPGGDVIIAPHSDPTSSRCNRVNPFHVPEDCPATTGLPFFPSYPTQPEQSPLLVLLFHHWLLSLTSFQAMNRAVNTHL